MIGCCPRRLAPTRARRSWCRRAMGFDWRSMSTFLRDRAPSRACSIEPPTTGATIFPSSLSTTSIAGSRWSLRTSAGGVLSEVCPVGMSDSYVFDPENPSPTICGSNLTLDSGPCDQRKIEQRNDTLVYTTDTLEDPLEISGRLSGSFNVELDQLDVDLVVRVTDVYPDGRSLLITEGVARIAARGSLVDLTEVEPGEVVQVEVDLLSTSIILNRGHRLRISVTSSNSPRYRVNHNNGARFSADPGDPLVVEVTLHHSAELSSYIELPTPSAAETPVSCERTCARLLLNERRLASKRWRRWRRGRHRPGAVRSSPR